MDTKTAIIVAHDNGNFADLRKPRSFLNIGNNPLIHHTVRNFAGIGVKRFGFAVGDYPEYYDQLAFDICFSSYQFLPSFDTFKFEATIIRNDIWQETGSLQTFYNALNFLPDDFFLVEAHILFESYGLDLLIKMKDSSCILGPNIYYITKELSDKIADYCFMTLKSEPKTSINDAMKTFKEQFHFQKTNLAYSVLENQESLEFALNYVYPRL